MPRDERQSHPVVARSRDGDLRLNNYWYREHGPEMPRAGATRASVTTRWRQSQRAEYPEVSQEAAQPQEQSLRRRSPIGSLATCGAVLESPAIHTLRSTRRPPAPLSEDFQASLSKRAGTVRA